MMRMRLRQAKNEATDGSARWRPTTLLIGDWDQGELAEAVAMLRMDTDLLAVAGIEQAVRLVSGTSESGRVAFLARAVGAGAGTAWPVFGA